MEQETDTSTPAMELVDASYQRCCAVPDFFRHFYGNFLASDERVAALFAETELVRQGKLLQHAVGLMLIFAKRGNPVMLERIADRHGTGDLNVPADLFPAFVESFVTTVAEHDPAYTPELDAAWREVMAPGIQFMIGRR